MSSKFGKMIGILSILAAGIFFAVPAMAQEAAPAAAAGSEFLSTSSMLAFSLAIAALGGSLAQGNAIARAMEGIARNPEAAGKIQSNLITGLAFIESLTIYALLVCFILK